MSRQVELGRAVLDMPNTNHELWLTTLITVLPEQNATYLAQLTPANCLEYLSSGVPWVHRGNDMHMILRLTLHNEALPCKQLQDVANAVLRAPIWEQLMLRPSLPTNVTTAPGTMQLNISHVATNRRDAEQKRHRIFTDVPPSDMRPPDGVVSVALQSIHLSVDILETSPRRKLIVRQSNPSSSGSEVPRSEAEDVAMSLFDLDSKKNTLHPDAAKSMKLVSNRKRKRSITDMSSAHRQLASRVLNLNETGTQDDSGFPPQSGLFSTLPSQTEIRTMVESAIRLSIRGTISRPHSACKIKASTFRLGLADIAPTVWRYGYLDALSHRAQLMPTITQSLLRTVVLKATSVSLKCKIQSIENIVCANQQDKGHESRHDNQPCIARTKSSIAAQLWNHTQKVLLRDPIPPTRACVASDPDEVNVGSDDMLAEEDNEWLGGVYRANNDDLIHSSSSKTIDGRCSRPVAPPIVISDNRSSRVCQQPSGEPILGNCFPEFDEELLFDFMPQKAVSNTEAS